MNPEHQSLWNKIKDFPIDDANASFSFSHRLARENGWSRSYALRVVVEYKKFLFLCCITEQGVTPSDPVDQAWHLHLTYTKSYWIDLCRNTVGKELHHNPTKGGQKEAEKFDDFYTATRRLYKEKFGVDPPEDIWQGNNARFTDIDFQRINLKRHWIIKKPALRIHKSFVVPGIGLFALFFIQARFDISSYVFIGFLIILGIFVYRQKRNGENNSGCSTAGCSSGCGHSSHGDGGCSSGCSGCSGSGCSGCGGGGD